MANNKAWIIIFVALTIISAFNVASRFTPKEQLAPVNAPMGIDPNVRAYELSFNGKKLKWPETLEVLGEGQLNPPEGYGVVLAIDELSCDACRDDQTQFILSIARELSVDVTRIVIASKQKLYARSYLRMNKVEIPVFYDQDHSFFKANRLNDTPVVLFHNPQGEVIASHFPTPGQPELSLPFHNFCRSFLGLERKPLPEGTPNDNGQASAEVIPKS